MNDDLKTFLGKLHTFLEGRKDDDAECAELLAELEPILFAEVMGFLR